MITELAVAIFQTQPRKGKLAGNRALLASAFAELGDDPVDLVVFPEAAFTGYFLEGATFECAVSAEVFAEMLATEWRASAATAAVQRGVDIVAGFYENESGTLYNSAIAVRVDAQSSAVRHVHRKVFLPTYGVFDEARFVSRGRSLQSFPTPFGNTAICICEDLWHGIMPTIAAMTGARMLIVPSASPGRDPQAGNLGSLARWRELLRSAATEHGIFILYSGLVGFEGGKGMTGSSCILDPFGQVLGTAPLDRSAVLRATLDLSEIDVARAALPLLGDLREAMPDLLIDLERSMR